MKNATKLQTTSPTWAGPNLQNSGVKTATRRNMHKSMDFQPDCFSVLWVERGINALTPCESWRGPRSLTARASWKRVQGPRGGFWSSLRKTLWSTWTRCLCPMGWGFTLRSTHTGASGGYEWVHLWVSLSVRLTIGLLSFQTIFFLYQKDQLRPD